MEGFWETFYDAVREMFFSDKVFVFREIVNEARTIREIAEKLGMPYVTVRKYIKWGYERGLATVVGTKKERGALSEKWLLTFIPRIVDIKEDNLVVRIKLKIQMRREFCEQICLFKDECPVYQDIKEGNWIIPYREIEIDKRSYDRDVNNICRIAEEDIHPKILVERSK